MKPSCGTCKHWLLRETPRWGVDMGMAVCALKLTKAVTIAHWKACRKHEALPDDMAGARAEFVARFTQAGSQATPHAGSFRPDTSAGHSRRDLGLLHGAAKGVK